MYNIIEKRFGRLVAKERISRHDQDRRKRAGRWLCVCDCGEITYVMTKHLISGGVRSCGCLARQQRRNLRFKHGHSGTREHRAWWGMICNHRRTGVTIEPSWQNYPAFRKAMGACPPGKNYLCRQDTTEGYSVSNCRWGSRTEQSSRTRLNRMITFRGQTTHLSDWARRLKLSYSMLERRLRQQKMSVEEAFTRPHRLAKREAQRWMRDNRCIS